MVRLPDEAIGDSADGQGQSGRSARNNTADLTGRERAAGHIADIAEAERQNIGMSKRVEEAAEQALTEAEARGRKAGLEEAAELVCPKPQVVEERTCEEIAAAIRSLSSSPPAADLRTPDPRSVTEFAAAVLHGDPEHRTWLTEAAHAFVNGWPLPPPRSATDQSGWQPIATAPKDGVAILILMKETHLVFGPRMTVAQFDVEYSGPDDASERIRWKDQMGAYNIKATHWRPLPPPPVLSPEKEPSNG